MTTCAFYKLDLKTVLQKVLNLVPLLLSQGMLHTCIQHGFYLSTHHLNILMCCTAMGFTFLLLISPHHAYSAGCQVAQEPPTFMSHWQGPSGT